MQSGQQSRTHLRTPRDKTVPFSPRGGQKRRQHGGGVGLRRDASTPDRVTGFGCREKVRVGRTLLAPGSCSACSRQLANTIGRTPPQHPGRCTRRADSSPSLLRNSPRRKTNPTKEVPNAAEASCVRMIGVPSGRLGHSLPRPAASDSPRQSWEIGP